MQVFTFEIRNGVRIRDDEGQVSIEAGVNEHRVVRRRTAVIQSRTRFLH